MSIEMFFSQICELLIASDSGIFPHWFSLPKRIRSQKVKSSPSPLIQPVMFPAESSDKRIPSSRGIKFCRLTVLVQLKISVPFGYKFTKTKNSIYGKKNVLKVRSVLYGYEFHMQYMLLKKKT